MRNLKKVLALALAVVMLVGMMVVGAGAASYKDTVGNDNAVAIEVVSAIKALEGSNGNFRPDGKLTRADGAVIAARVALTRGVADKLVGASGVYTDVSAKHYASGAIAWATNEGYLSGDGSGTFRPNGSLYGVHFAKMLLGVLGYDAKVEGFTGSDYVQKIILAAAQAGLLEGLEDVELNAKITRGQAALMAFNALNAREVEYDGGYDITIGGVTITQGAKRDFKSATVTDTLGSTKYALTQRTLVANGTPDRIPTVQWGITPAGGTWTAIAGTAESVTPAMTITGAITAVPTGYTVEAGIVNADIVTNSGNGVTQKLYIDATKNIYTVIRSYEDLDTVTSVKVDKEGNVTKIVLANAGTFVCANATTGAPATAGFDTLVEMGVEATDKVLVKVTVAPKYTDNTNDGVDNGTVTTDTSYAVLGAPAYVSGVATKQTKDNKTFVLGGTELTFAKGKETGLTLGGNTYALLSSEGLVLATGAINDAPEAPNYLVVTETWSVATGNTKEPVKYYFTGVNMAGEVVEGQYAPSVYDADETAGGYNWKSDLNTVTITGNTNQNPTVTYPTAHAKNLTMMVEYSINAKTGVYTLRNANLETNLPTVAQHGAIAADHVELLSTGKFFASNVEFVFLYGLKADGVTEIVAPTTATGVQKVLAASNYCYFLDETSTYVTRVFVQAIPAVDPVVVLPEYVDGIYYVTADIDANTAFDSFEVVGEGDDMITLGNLTVYVDGEKTELTLVVDNTTRMPIDAEGNLDINAGFHKVELDEDGYATLTPIANAVAANKDTSKTVLVSANNFDLTGGKIKLINGKYMIEISSNNWIDASAAIVLDLATTPAQNETLRDIAFNAANTTGAVGDTITTALTAEIIYNNVKDDQNNVIDSSVIGIIIHTFTTGTQS